MHNVTYPPVTKGEELEIARLGSLESDRDVLVSLLSRDRLRLVVMLTLM